MKVNERRKLHAPMLRICPNKGNEQAWSFEHILLDVLQESMVPLSLRITYIMKALSSSTR
jgi:hypothetical protein